MKMPGFLQNPGVKGVGGVAVLETAARLTSQYTGLDSAIGTAIGAIQGAVDFALQNSNFLTDMTSNQIFEPIAIGAGIGTAVALSNEIMKDFGMVSEGNTLTLKNMARYAVNVSAGIGAFAAGSAALPYIIGGGITYWAGKHGWTASKETLKGLYSGIGGMAKNIIKTPLAGSKATKNSFGNSNFTFNPKIN